MANEIITTLHPDQDPNIDLYPNIKKDNIPNKSIDRNKLDDNVNNFLNSLLNSVNELHPSGTGSSDEILAFIENKGIYVATSGDLNGHWFYWDGTQYVDGGVYQATEIPDGSITPQKTDFVDKFYNLIDYNDQLPNTLWSTSTTTTTSSGWYALPSIKLKANTIYYFDPTTNANINNFCWLGNSRLSSFSGYNATNGTITMGNDDLELKLSMGMAFNANRKLLNTTMYLYNNQAYYYIPNLLIKEEIKDNGFFYVGSTRNITTLKDAFEITEHFKNMTIYVDKGVYDLVSEYGAVLETTSTIIGLVLKNNSKFIFENGAKITFNYTGNNNFIKQNFSPINTGVYGGTLFNCEIECSNCRYCIHDERSSTTDTYHNQFIDCKFTIDNSNNSVWTQDICIGGGLGESGLIEIIQCIFKTSNTFANDRKGAYYHNNTGSSTTAKSKIYFINNYMIDATFWFNPYGVSQEISECYATGNSTIGKIYQNHEANNGVLYAWNNDIRDNANGNYSTDEFNTGNKWIDGKYIYKKTIQLPVITNENVDITLPSISTLVNIEFVFYSNNDNSVRRTLPLISSSGTIVGNWYINSNTLTIWTNTTTAYTGYVTIYYTK